MAQYLNFDLENVSGDNNYGMKLIAFPNRVKITNVIFTVNWEMWGTAEEDRTWLLYALASHPYDNEGSDNEWYWPIFGEAEKPVVARSSNVRFCSDVAPTGVYSAPIRPRTSFARSTTVLLLRAITLGSGFSATPVTFRAFRGKIPDALSRLSTKRPPRSLLTRLRIGTLGDNFVSWRSLQPYGSGKRDHLSASGWKSFRIAPKSTLNHLLSGQMNAQQLRSRLPALM